MSEANDRVSQIFEDCAIEEYVLATDEDDFGSVRRASLFRYRGTDPYALSVSPDSFGDAYCMEMTRDQLIDAAIAFLKVAEVTEWMVDRTPRGPGHPR